MILKDVTPEQKLNQIFGLESKQQQGIPNSRGREYSRRIVKLENGNDEVLANYSMAYKRDNPGIAHSTLSTDLFSLCGGGKQALC
jgi:hypothetical protein